jgi:hypothetical protein
MLRTIGFLLGGSGILTAGLLSNMLEMNIIGGILLGIGVLDSGIGVYDHYIRRSVTIVTQTPEL